MISNEQWNAITESPFFKAEIGKTYSLIMKNWRVETRIFRKSDGSEDKKLMLVLEVVSVNGESPSLGREIATSNRLLCAQLHPIIIRAEAARRNFIRVQLMRIDNRNYTVVDLDLVNDAVYSKATTPL